MGGTLKAPRTRTQGQNRRIWGIASKLEALGNTSPDLIPSDVKRLGGKDLKRGWVKYLNKQVNGQTSSSSLLEHEAARLIKKMEARLKALQKEIVGEAPRPTAGARFIATITPAQQDYIQRLIQAVASLEGEWSGMARDPAKVKVWAQRYLKSPWPQTQEDADQAIEAWKSILERSLPDLPALWTCLEKLKNLSAGVLTEWETQFVVYGRSGKGTNWGPLQWAKLYEIARQRLPPEAVPAPP